MVKGSGCGVAVGLPWDRCGFVPGPSSPLPPLPPPRRLRSFSAAAFRGCASRIAERRCVFSFGGAGSPSRATEHSHGGGRAVMLRDDAPRLGEWYIMPFMYQLCTLVTQG